MATLSCYGLTIRNSIRNPRSLTLARNPSRPRQFLDFFIISLLIFLYVISTVDDNSATTFNQGAEIGNH